MHSTECLLVYPWIGQSFQVLWCLVVYRGGVGKRHWAEWTCEQLLSSSFTPAYFWTLNCADATAVLWVYRWCRCSKSRLGLIFLWYDTIWYDSVYLTCSKKLTGSQLSLPHGTDKKLKCKTKNKMRRLLKYSSLCRLDQLSHLTADYWVYLVSVNQ